MRLLEMLEQRQLLSISAPTDIAAALASSSAADNAAPLAAPAAAAAIVSLRAGLWSDGSTWSGGHVPGPGDDVVITHNVTIDSAQARQVTIDAGTVTLAGDLHAYGSVIVHSRLQGTQGAIYFHVADDRLFTGNTAPGPDPAMPDFHPEDTGLWVLPGGAIDLHGEEVTSWLDALGAGTQQSLGKGVSRQVSFGGSSAVLQSAPVGWRVGDTLLLVSEQGESRLAELLSVSGTSITYRQKKDTPTQPDLVGHTLITAGSSTLVQSKIANLSRRVQIVSADVEEGDTHHRAHTISMDGATANLVNVEFRDLGPREKLGRYPVHFHHGEDALSNLIGSSIWQDVSEPGNRFVAVHGMQGVTIADNVALGSRGHGFFFEDGHEYDNTVTGNLSVNVTGGEELDNVDSDVTDVSHHFWLRVGNTISGNVAAGGDAIGMIVLDGHAHGTTVVSDTEVLGAGVYGIWTGAPNVTFVNAVAVYNERAGFASDPAWDVDVHNVTLMNPLMLFNGTSDSSYGSQVYLNNGSVTVDGGVMAGDKAIHTHYHSSFTVKNSKIDVNILQTPTYWEQAGTFDHATIRAGLLFERAYPTPRYVSPGLVHFVATSVQVGSGPVTTKTTDFMGNISQYYPMLPGIPIPNAIELNQPAPASGFLRVTLLPDSERWREPIRIWSVTPIGQAVQKQYWIYERQSTWAQQAAYGGYPDGLPPGQYAVKLYDEDGVLLKQGFADIRSGQVSDVVPTLDTESQVVGRRLFYNNSKYDGFNPAAGAADDLALASDKVAYLPQSAAATFANVSSYTKGINGVAIDLAGPHGTLTAADFTFKVGTSNTPGSWSTAPAPLAVVVRAGAGASGSDRVEIIWADGAVVNQWLEVTLKSNANTGLAAPDVFYFGSRVGDSGEGNAPGFATTNSADEVAARNHPSTRFANIPVNNLYDYNRDGQVNATDQLAARRGGGSLPLIRIAPAAPAINDEGAVAAALAGSAIRADQPLAATLREFERPVTAASAAAFAVNGASHPLATLTLPNVVAATGVLEDCVLEVEEELLEGLWVER